MAKFVKLFKNEEGATAIEYGLIAALIAVAAIAAMQNIGSKLSTTFDANLFSTLACALVSAVPHDATTGWMPACQTCARSKYPSTSTQ